MEDIVKLPTLATLEQTSILKELISAHRHLAGLNESINSIPNGSILLLNLTLQEAKDSSAIENIITTQESLYKHSFQPQKKPSSDKEIHNYSEALLSAWRRLKERRGISCNDIIDIQKIIEPNKTGFRAVPGTVLKNPTANKIIYTPPSPEKIIPLMQQLESFINEKNSMDPLVRMALTHFYFESIHPFYDGNGRTGRIINVLQLSLYDLLDSPVLYLSRYILRNRSEYYRLLQQVREKENWEDWVIYILKGVASISEETKDLIKKIYHLFMEYKKGIRDRHSSFYSHDLINSIFSSPFKTIKSLEKDLKVSNATAKRHLNALAEDGFLGKFKAGSKNYYINERLFDLLNNS